MQEAPIQCHEASYNAAEPYTVPGPTTQYGKRPYSAAKPYTPQQGLIQYSNGLYITARAYTVQQAPTQCSLYSAQYAYTT